MTYKAWSDHLPRPDFAAPLSAKSTWSIQVDTDTFGEGVNVGSSVFHAPPAWWPFIARRPLRGLTSPASFTLRLAGAARAAATAVVATGTAVPAVSSMVATSSRFMATSCAAPAWVIR
ncbi:hypothetical protein PF010_g7254 [Phytophthora fragariae]|uniref:Uncharacterized protein n=1 Tax=Phytophthora fragariae TaxID=53985 RepID=A0A6A3KDP1_9STRA|nr:hypothetical protein PF011_g13150 [Phytophthora fragariae]KAE9121060.1 hypothetical protein PF010_g7254 [Phytophthora fragariae]